MNTSLVEIQVVSAENVLYATPNERAHWEWSGDREGIHWPDLDEDISVEGIIAGRRSGESQRSLQRWLEARKALS